MEGGREWDSPVGYLWWGSLLMLGDGEEDDDDDLQDRAGLTAGGTALKARPAAARKHQHHETPATGACQSSHRVATEPIQPVELSCERTIYLKIEIRQVMAT